MLLPSGNGEGSNTSVIRGHYYSNAVSILLNPWVYRLSAICAGDIWFYSGFCADSSL
jgi:hypothetical protein